MAAIDEDAQLVVSELDAHSDNPPEEVLPSSVQKPHTKGLRHLLPQNMNAINTQEEPVRVVDHPCEIVTGGTDPRALVLELTGASSKEDGTSSNVPTTGSTTIEEVLEALPWCRSLIYYVGYYACCCYNFALNVGYVFFLFNILHPASSMPSLDESQLRRVSLVRFAVVMLHFGGLFLGCLCGSRVVRRHGCRPVVRFGFGLLAALSITRLILLPSFFHSIRAIHVFLLVTVPVHGFTAAMCHTASQRLFYDVIPSRKHLKTLSITLFAMALGSWWLCVALLVGGETARMQSILIEFAVVVSSVVCFGVATLLCESPRFLETRRSLQEAKQAVDRILRFSRLPSVRAERIVERPWHPYLTSSFYLPLDASEYKRYFLTWANPGVLLLCVYALVGYLIYTMFYSSDGLTMLPSIAAEKQGSIAGTILIYETLDAIAARFARRKSKSYPGAQTTCGTALLLVYLSFLLMPYFWTDFWLILARFGVAVTLYSANFISVSLFPLRVQDDISLFSCSVFLGAFLGIAPMRLLVDITNPMVERWVVLAVCFLTGMLVLWNPRFDAANRTPFDAAVVLSPSSGEGVTPYAKGDPSNDSINAGSATEWNRVAQSLSSRKYNVQVRTWKKPASSASSSTAASAVKKAAITTAPTALPPQQQGNTNSLDQEVLKITGTRMRI